MSLPEEIFFVCLLGYFLTLNSLYLAITVAALVQLHRRAAAATSTSRDSGPRRPRCP